MGKHRNDHWNRREFLSAATLAGTGTLLGAPDFGIAAEPPPETTKLRLARVPSICTAPLYIGEELLRGEGFTDVQYVEGIGGLPTAKAMAAGQIDVSMNFAAPLTVSLDAGDSIVVLAVIHVGCFGRAAAGNKENQANPNTGHLYCAHVRR